MTRVLAIANQKGGVGKTTTAVNLSASLAATRRRVLLIDLDPQGNASTGCGLDKNDLEWTSYHLLTQRCAPAAAITRAEACNIDVIGANADLTAAEIELMNEIGREYRLRKALSALTQYDFILIDCPPSLNILTINALVAANGLLIPMQCEYYALEGLAALMRTIGQVQETVNPDLRIEGILRTMYDPRNTLTQDVSAQIHEYFGDAVYRSVIPRNVRLAEAPSHGLPALQYDRNSRGALAYLTLAGEMIRRGQVRPSARQETAQTA